MEYIDIILIGITAIMAVLTYILYVKIEDVNDVGDGIDFISMKITDLAERLEDIEEYFEADEEDEDEDQEDVESPSEDIFQEWDAEINARINSIQNLTNEHISEISDLRNMIAGLNQQLGEVAAFADRLSSRIDNLNDRPE